jgi:uncharacterized membrane protein
MNEPKHGWTEHQIEQVVGYLLRVGVLVSAAVVLLGAVLYLAQEGATVPDYGKFKGEPPGLEHVGSIVQGALRFRGRYVIQFGILLLMATPVARVVLTVFAFAWQRDRFYVAVTLFVLAILVASLMGLSP